MITPMSDTDRAPSIDAVLALDLGASRVRAGVVDGAGRVVARAEARTPVEAGPQGVVATAVGMLRRVRDEAPPAVRDAIAGVGIAAVGPLDPAAGNLVEPPNMPRSFRGAALAGPVGAALGLRAELERDTHVAALAEWSFGAARDLTDFLYLTVSTGIGGAIVAGGRLIGGPDGVAGELGHVLVEIDGPPCGCGARGHLEGIASGSAIARAAAGAIAAGRAGGLASFAAARGRGLDARDVAEAEADGDTAGGGDHGSCPAGVRRGMRVARRRVQPAADRRRRKHRQKPGRSLAWAGARTGRGCRLLRPAGSVSRSSGAALGDDVGLIGALPLIRRRVGGRRRAESQKTGPASRRGPSAIARVRTQPPILKTLPPQIGHVP